MFKSDRSAKMAVCALMLFVAVVSVALFFDKQYEVVSLGLGVELVFIWAYLNPWIMQVKYTIPLFLDSDRMRYNAFAISGLVVVAGSAVLIVW
jgi:hypothetical protein